MNSENIRKNIQKGKLKIAIKEWKDETSDIEIIDFLTIQEQRLSSVLNEDSEGVVLYENKRLTINKVTKALTEKLSEVESNESSNSGTNNVRENITCAITIIIPIAVIGALVYSFPTIVFGILILAVVIVVAIAIIDNT